MDRIKGSAPFLRCHLYKQFNEILIEIEEQIFWNGRSPTERIAHQNAIFSRDQVLYHSVAIETFIGSVPNRMRFVGHPQANPFRRITSL